MLDFKNALLDSLDPISKDLMKDPLHGTRAITLREIDNRLMLAYGILSSSDLSKNEDNLQLSYRINTPVREFISSHRIAHNVALRNGQPFPESQKVQFLLSALKQCGIFNLRCQMWQMEYPQVVNQTFELLVTAIQEFSDNYSQDATSASTGFSAAVHPDNIPDLQFLISTAVAAAVANLPNKSNLASPPLYCWTHGLGNHPSSSCRHPASDHINTATAKNSQEGSQRVAGRGRTSG